MTKVCVLLHWIITLLTWFPPLVNSRSEYISTDHPSSAPCVVTCGASQDGCGLLERLNEGQTFSVSTAEVQPGAFHGHQTDQMADRHDDLMVIWRWREVLMI